MTETKSTVLFDFGNTLAEYYTREEFPTILGQSINSVIGFLRKDNLLKVPWHRIWERVEQENREKSDCRVVPLEERLLRIFGLEDKAHLEGFIGAMCRCFMRPISATGRLYDDTIPALRILRANNFQTAIVSNTPWGSPAHLWRDELVRLGLADHATVTVFCRDVGWRKPAPQIFEYALGKLGTKPEKCVFIGDDPRWDLAGPRAVGIEAVHIDRHRAWPDVGEYSLRNLYEFLDRLGLESR